MQVQGRTYEGNVWYPAKQLTSRPLIHDKASLPSTTPDDDREHVGLVADGPIDTKQTQVEAERFRTEQTRPGGTSTIYGYVDDGMPNVDLPKLEFGKWTDRAVLACCSRRTNVCATMTTTANKRGSPAPGDICGQKRAEFNIQAQPAKRRKMAMRNIPADQAQWDAIVESTRNMKRLPFARLKRLVNQCQDKDDPTNPKAIPLGTSFLDAMNSSFGLFVGHLAATAHEHTQNVGQRMIIKDCDLLATIRATEDLDFLRAPKIK